MRADTDHRFMKVATVVAESATCDRLHVGAVLVVDKHIVATGYNGSMPGAPHCDDVGHLMEENHCRRTVHAETNAVVQAARHGTATDQATLYVTASPCWDCFKVIITAGIRRIVYGQAYRLDKKVVDHAALLGVELTPL